MKKGFSKVFILFITIVSILVIILLYKIYTKENVQNQTDISYVQKVNDTAEGQGSWTVDGKPV